MLDGNTTCDGLERASGISMISSDLISTSSSDTRNYTFYVQLTPKSYTNLILITLLTFENYDVIIKSLKVISFFSTVSDIQSLERPLTISFV